MDIGSVTAKVLNEKHVALSLQDRLQCYSNQRGLEAFRQWEDSLVANRKMVEWCFCL